MTFTIGGIRDIPGMMKELGYIHRSSKNDFIKEDVNGRFHAKTIRDGAVNIHYDFYGIRGRHIASIPMPNLLKTEQSRIQKLIYQNEQATSRK